jgi:hypothetical protein
MLFDHQEAFGSEFAGDAHSFNISGCLDAMGHGDSLN